MDDRIFLEYDPICDLHGRKCPCGFLNENALKNIINVTHGIPMMYREFELAYELV